MTEEYPPLTDRELNQLASTHRLGWEGFADEEALAILRLVAEVRRLRAREAALREALEVYADPHFWQIQSIIPLGSFKASSVIPAARDGGAKAREALAADPSAPATTEGTP